MGNGPELLIGVVIALGAGLWLLYVASRRAITLVELEMRGGELEVLRGGIAPRVLADLRDVARAAPKADAKVRVVRDRGLAKVEIDGHLDAAHAQRVRNVIGSLPLAKLANARRR
ncbi:MAG: DUF3634 family protein [Myxococcales bacterium]|nr:DUF3634 family protein [Myxococcales bacterium]